MEINDNGERSLSIYTKNELTPEVVMQSIAKIKAAFPSLSTDFYNLFMDRVKEKGFSNKRLIDSVNNVIDNCQYPTPTLANFLQFDKRIKAISYDDLCTLAMRNEAKFENYHRYSINGGKPFYIKKSDKDFFGLPDEF